MGNSWKNRCLLRLVKILQPKVERNLRCERILIVTTTALGDTLWATPALENLRRQFPSAHIAVLTSPIGRQALQHHPCIDQFFLLEEPLLPRFFSLLRQLKRARFDVALLFHASQRLVLPLSSLSGIPRIIGTLGQKKGLDDLLTEGIEPAREHEIERRLKIVERLGVPCITKTLSYFVQEEERVQALQFIGSHPKPWIAFHPGSKEPFRRYPPRCFATVGQALQKRFGGTIFLTGTVHEASILQEIQSYLPTAKLTPLNTSVRFLAAFLEQMDLFLSNDTGPFHLACAMNRPAVGLYVSTDPLLCGPHKAKHAIAIAKKPTCVPCIKRRCQEPFCFLQISPDEIIDACSRILN